jgi:DIS3-like exonuclease 2
MSQDQLQTGLKRGHLFRVKMRVNAGDRREAYATLPGLPADVLLRGELAQNRGVEGDDVALELLPTHDWYTVHRTAAALQQQQRQQAGAPAAGSAGSNAMAQLEER